MLRSRRGWLRRLTRADEGAALVEFAIVVPVLLMLLYGIFEIGFALWYHHNVNEGVRDGVRYLARMPLTGTFITQAENIPKAASPVIPPWVTSAPTINTAITNVGNSAGTYRGPDPLPVITMTATATVSMPLLSFFGIGPTIAITVADQQRHIG